MNDTPDRTHPEGPLASSESIEIALHELVD
jgi:hypothetical protein